MRKLVTFMDVEKILEVMEKILSQKYGVKVTIERSIENGRNGNT